MGLLVLAGTFDVHDSVACDPALALQLGAKLARRTELHVIQKELIVDWIGTPLDDDAIRL